MARATRMLGAYLIFAGLGSLNLAAGNVVIGIGMLALGYATLALDLWLPDREEEEEKSND